MSDETQATILKPCGDPHFAMEHGVFEDTVMEKIRNRDLNMSAIKVWMYLSRNRDLRSGKLHGIKIERIAEYWNISTRSVRRALADLIDAELYDPPNRMKEVVTGVLFPKVKKKVDE